MNNKTNVLFLYYYQLCEYYINCFDERRWFYFKNNIEINDLEKRVLGSSFTGIE